MKFSQGPAGAHLRQRSAWPGHFDIGIDCIAAVADKS
jgi:hypothetical protein